MVKLREECPDVYGVYDTSDYGRQQVSEGRRTEGLLEKTAYDKMDYTVVVTQKGDEFTASVKNNQFNWHQGFTQRQGVINQKQLNAGQPIMFLPRKGRIGPIAAFNPLIDGFISRHPIP